MPGWMLQSTCRCRFRGVASQYARVLTSAAEGSRDGDRLASVLVLGNSRELACPLRNPGHVYTSGSGHTISMNGDLIIGYHGKPRCAWAGAGETAFGRYHDEVWGTRTYAESALFEALTLGVFQVGLSWSVVFGKREAFRSAFKAFEVTEVAAMTEKDIDQLVQDASIIRNRGKIRATVDNATAMLSASPNLAALAQSYAVDRKRAPLRLAELPTSTPQSADFARQLKSQGYRFVGPTSVYAFMQNVGVVNDHLHGCFRATDYGTGGGSR
jgi:DNA-3-methyladenine glycosylase I